MGKGLTDTKIRNAKPRDKKYKIYDSGGLYTPTMQKPERFRVKAPTRNV